MLERHFPAGVYARLEYSGNLRAGTISCIEPTMRIEFAHEMGAGACRFHIEVPTAARRVAATGSPLSRRDEILRFVAVTVQREQCSGWQIEIQDEVIRFT